jgi:hypothetical protein
VISPTPLVHEVAHASTREAAERVRLAVGEDITRPFRATELERAVLTLGACAATLLAFDVVDNHGLGD